MMDSVFDGISDGEPLRTCEGRLDGCGEGKLDGESL